MSASNYLVLLAVVDEDHLLDFADIAWYGNEQYVLFNEPDLGDEHTALAVLPSPGFKKKLARLPLLFKREGVKVNGL